MSPKPELHVIADKNPTKAIAREMEEGLRDIVSLASALAFMGIGMPSQYQRAITIVADLHHRTSESTGRAALPGRWPKQLRAAPCHLNQCCD
jgi:hypothetical protein